MGQDLLKSCLDTENVLCSFRDGGPLELKKSLTMQFKNDPSFGAPFDPR